MIWVILYHWSIGCTLKQIFISPSAYNASFAEPYRMIIVIETGKTGSFGQMKGSIKDLGHKFNQAIFFVLCLSPLVNLRK